MRTKLLAFLLVVLAPACVLLDLFPEGDGQGTGGPGGTGMGGAGTGGETNATTSSSAGGGPPGVAVEAVFGASPDTGVTSLRFLDVAVSGEQVAVVGHMLNSGGVVSIGLGPSCSTTTNVQNGFFVARFGLDGSCQTIHFYDAAELGPSPTGSIAFLGTDPAATDVVVAVSDANRSRVSRIDPAGNEDPSNDLSVGGAVVTDLAPCGLDVLAGGAISAPANACFPNEFLAQDTDAWVVQLAGGTSCFPDALEHSETSGFEQRVVSVACDGDRRGAVTETLGDMTVGSMPVDADSSAAFFQALDGRPEVLVLGDFTCASSNAAPRLLLDAEGDWMFGADCNQPRVWFRPPFTPWSIVNDVAPAPNVFDRPSIAVGPGFLFFGGEYASSRGGAPWPSPVRTGVIGAVNGDGNVLFTFDVVGSGMGDDTEVMAVATSPTPHTTGWAVGNYSSHGVTVDTKTFEDNLVDCDQETLCKPFLAKVRLQ